MNASPAPVVSTASTFGLTRWSREPVRLSATRAPAAPRVTTTERGPSARSAGAQSCGPSPASSPRMYRASCSLTTSGSQAASTSPGSGAGGEGLRTSRVSGPRPRTVSATVSSGISSCTEITRAAASSGAAARTSSGVRRPLAPGETTMLLSPEGSTVISATPVGAPPTRTPSVSTPAARWESSNRRPWSSSPTRASRAVLAPRRAAASDWLAPLPPGWTARSEPRTVSPGAGRRSTPITRSALADPTTSRSYRSSGALSCMGVLPAFVGPGSTVRCAGRVQEKSATFSRVTTLTGTFTVLATSSSFAALTAFCTAIFPSSAGCWATDA